MKSYGVKKGYNTVQKERKKQPFSSKFKLITSEKFRNKNLFYAAYIFLSY